MATGLTQQGLLALAPTLFPQSGVQRLCSNESAELPALDWAPQRLGRRLRKHSSSLHGPTLLNRVCQSASAGHPSADDGPIISNSGQHVKDRERCRQSKRILLCHCEERQRRSYPLLLEGGIASLRSQ